MLTATSDVNGFTLKLSGGQKMNKKILLLLTTALVSLWLHPTYEISSSHYEISSSKEKSFILSKKPKENTTLVLKDRTLLIRNLPKTEMFNYVMVKLIGVEDSLPMKKCKNTRQEVYDVKFGLQDVPNGTYSVEIYSASEQYTTYFSYTHNQPLCIQITDSSVDFVLSPAVNKNKKIFDANKQDSATLAYYLKPSKMIESEKPTIVEQAKNITDGLSTNYDKLMAIHDWVCENIWYDYDALYKGISGDTASADVLASRKGICIGYASLTAALLRAAEIPTKLVAGYVLNSSPQENWTKELIAGNNSNHVWNEAYVDGRWIIIDTTYDSNNTYKNKRFSMGTGMKNRKYFDITIEFLSTDRRLASSESIPAEYR